jgi:hypothetical protein
MPASSFGYLDGADSHHEAAEALLTRVVDDDLGTNPLTLAEVLVVPARTGRLDTVLLVLRDIDVQALPFPTDTAVRLAKLRADTGLKMSECCSYSPLRTSRRSTLGSRRWPKRAVWPFSGADHVTSVPIHGLIGQHDLGSGRNRAAKSTVAANHKVLQPRRKCSVKRPVTRSTISHVSRHSDGDATRGGRMG